MKLFAPAKINLYLRIEGRRDDGYHLLDTLMAPISLGDEVEVTGSEGAPGAITVRADDPTVPLGEDNTVHRAARAFQDSTGCRAPVAVSIRKRIPMGAGLGGGSTDAAAALRGMNDLFDAGLSAGDLEALALDGGRGRAVLHSRRGRARPRHRRAAEPRGRAAAAVDGGAFPRLPGFDGLGLPQLPVQVDKTLQQ